MSLKLQEKVLSKTLYKLLKMCSELHLTVYFFDYKELMMSQKLWYIHNVVRYQRYQVTSFSIIILKIFCSWCKSIFYSICKRISERSHIILKWCKSKNLVNDIDYLSGPSLGHGVPFIITQSNPAMLPNLPAFITRRCISQPYNMK